MTRGNCTNFLTREVAGDSSLQMIMRIVKSIRNKCKENITAAAAAAAAVVELLFLTQNDRLFPQAK
jgi:hypothetical protein